MTLKMIHMSVLLVWRYDGLKVSALASGSSRFKPLLETKTRDEHRPDGPLVSYADFT